MDMEAGVRPREHARGLVRVEQRQAHEAPEPGAAERFRQPGGVEGGPRDKRAIGPEPAVGHEQVQMRAATRASSPSWRRRLRP
jgi:hypothetical protein